MGAECLEHEEMGDFEGRYGTGERMKGPGHALPPLLVEWSPNRVRAFDPSTRTLSTGTTMAECVQGPQAGREVIVGIGQRSAFIRSLTVPNGSRADIAKVLEFQLGALLPLKANEYVYGFRLAPGAGETGQLAVVGAIKTESLRRVHAEANGCGLKVAAVLPLAFGSWLAARERSILECIAVETDGNVVNLDLIHGGEICYSRSIPMPASPDELQDEVARTFKIAGVEPSPVFSTGCPGVHSEITCDKEPIQYLGALSTVNKLLFSIELPEEVEACRARTNRWKAQRAIAAALAALSLGGYAFTSRFPAVSDSTTATAGTTAALKSGQAKQALTRKRLAKTESANKILEIAFNPGQSVSDVVTVLSHSASKNSWFTNLTIARGAPISISGVAMSDGDLAKFAAAISKDPRFEEMRVMSSNKAFIGKRQVSQFLVLGKLRGLLAYDRPPKARKKGA